MYCRSQYLQNWLYIAIIHCKEIYIHIKVYTPSHRQTDRQTHTRAHASTNAHNIYTWMDEHIIKTTAHTLSHTYIHTVNRKSLTGENFDEFDDSKQFVKVSLPTFPC